MHFSGFAFHVLYVTGFLIVVICLFWGLHKLSSNQVLQAIWEFIIENINALFGFSILGLSIGLLSGSSLSPVLGNVIPSVLTFLGVLLVYIFSTDKTNTNSKNLGSISITCLCIFMLYGNQVSSLFRVKYEADRRLEDSNIQKDIEKFKIDLQKDLENHKTNLQKDYKKFEKTLDSLNTKK